MQLESLNPSAFLLTAGDTNRNASAEIIQPKHRQNWWGRTVREPMVHFVLAGSLIFAGAYYFEHIHRNASQLIIVDAAIKDRLAKLYTLQLGTQPTSEQLDQLLETYVHDEVLYREALALGLDQGDEIIRRRLVQKMGFIQSDLNIAEQPSEVDLQRYYTQHRSDFSEPNRISFEQLYFSADVDGDAAAYQRAENALRKSGDATPNSSTDYSSLLPLYQQKTHDELERLFGATPIVDRLTSAEPGHWVGPVRSGYGWHIVRVTKKTTAVVPSFDSVRERVLAAVNLARKEESNRRSFSELLSHYTIDRQDLKQKDISAQATNAVKAKPSDDSTTYSVNAQSSDVVL